MPLNILLARPEIEARVAAASAKVVVDRPLSVGGEALSEIAEREEDDPAVLLVTSGTTGLPKGQRPLRRRAKRFRIELNGSVHGPPSASGRCDRMQR